MCSFVLKVILAQWHQHTVLYSSWQTMTDIRDVQFPLFIRFDFYLVTKLSNSKSNVNMEALGEIHGNKRGMIFNQSPGKTILRFHSMLFWKSCEVPEAALHNSRPLDDCRATVYHNGHHGKGKENQAVLVEICWDWKFSFASTGFVNAANLAS